MFMIMPTFSKGDMSNSARITSHKNVELDLKCGLLITEDDEIRKTLTERDVIVPIPRLSIPSNTMCMYHHQSTLLVVITKCEVVEYLISWLN